MSRNTVTARITIAARDTRRASAVTVAASRAVCAITEKGWKRGSSPVYTLAHVASHLVAAPGPDRDSGRRPRLCRLQPRHGQPPGDPAPARRARLGAAAGVRRLPRGRDPVLRAAFRHGHG